MFFTYYILGAMVQLKKYIELRVPGPDLNSTCDRSKGDFKRDVYPKPSLYLKVLTVVLVQDTPWMVGKLKITPYTT